ncbi:acyl-CoA desaturase [Agromyces intestinalis]|uniref:Acyl-CoA desaturase n=1 Tax=Agromyces intestinalis TaxID=2592652 RepID=A0A5C1YHN3_9MICO|nr:acyl-CoA desaturase [Agromyces intestinalis]QEO14547.1 acyl-CoA desaturase [Agromyces intestinalis]
MSLQVLERPEGAELTGTLTPVIRTAGRRRDDAIDPAQSGFARLSRQIKAEGLLDRHVGFYVRKTVLWALVAAASIGASLLIGDSWWQLLVAAVLGVVFTQFAFMAHEASHRQVFRSGPANDWAGLILANLVVGISYSWWMNKHTRHHGNPNVIGRDPDIQKDTISFLEEDAAASRGLVRLITRKQGYLFFPLLLLEGINLHAHGIRHVLGAAPVKRRRLEIALIAVRLIGVTALVFWAFPPLLAAVFLLVQLGVFGVYMGASFAPNHKGMPLIGRGVRVDFLERQVLTSRNIRGGWFIDAAMGGLNYQVEHHLFPSMARPALARTQEIVREYCRENDVRYTETGLIESYGIVIAYLNRVGLAARDPFDCPMIDAYRRRD